tara:strand:- start:372 stop:635 length:264 start_codon:yes stop_codon:yes gene_type:complete
METKRKFVTACMKVKYEDVVKEFEIKSNLTDKEMEDALSFWIPNAEDHSEESLCDFIHLLNSEYVAYSQQDTKYLTWLITCDIDAEC